MLKRKVPTCKIISRLKLNESFIANGIFDILLFLYFFSHVAFGWNISCTWIRRFITLTLLTYSGYGLIIRKFCKRGCILNISEQTLFFVAFIIFSFASVVWTVDVNATMAFSFTLALNFIIALMIQERMETKGDIDHVIRVLIFSSTMNALYVIYTSPESDGITRLGISEQFGNITNILASQSAIGFFLCLYYIFVLHLKGQKWIVYVFSEIVLLYAVVHCGSKMGILLLLMGTVIFLYTFSGIRIKLCYFILVPIIIALLIYAITEIKVLNTLYYKSFTSLMNQLLGRGGFIDTSTRERTGMMYEGMELWFSRPLLGWGASCFSKMASFDGVYSHNSYIEILCGMGGIGFILYYTFPVLNLIYLQMIKKNRNEARSMAFSLIICMLFYHIGSASYMSVYHLALFMIVDRMVAIETKHLSKNKLDNI